MQCMNPAARRRKQFLQELADAANLPTTNVRVTIHQGDYVNPEMVGGKVILPTVRACGGPVPFAQSWLHELQHANDYRTGVIDELQQQEAEARARAAEKLVSEETIEVIWKREQDKECYK